ncbi:MAG: hypothetical protein K5776_11500 [Lachnospiraceae bacterium]|nr:hypothetical protein [Lachnospiraceae bacterium]
MKRDDDFYNVESDESGRPLIGAALLFSGVIVGLIIIVVLIVNRDNLKFGKDKDIPQASSKSEGYVNLDDYISGSDKVSDDLDIWNEYLDDKEKEEPVVIAEEPEEPKEEDLSEGGTKTKVKKSDGSEVWLKINKYLAPNELDNAAFVLKNGRLDYYVDGEKVSHTGIIVDKNDDFVDFAKVKRDNIDFVFIKLGQRGYNTGNLSLDDNFYSNLKNAQDAGLHTGVLFFSQAVTTEEAQEEAQFVLDSLGEEKIDYPVCFYMDYIPNDKARVEDTTPEEKTTVSRAFMDKINEAGLNCILYGNKEWLLCNMNYTSISYYDIMLDQEEELPDFPYRFKMWKYATDDVAGVSGKSEMIISFIDYSVK